MENLKEYHDKMREIYSKMESHKENYTIKVNGIEIDVFPDVYSPEYYYDSEYFSKTVSKIVGNKKFLEIGCGTGIIGISVALNGGEVSMVDINPIAVENTRHNLDKNKVQGKVYLGDIYDPLPKGKKFDFIFWSHPFNKGDKKGESYLIQSGFDYQYEGIKKYVQQAHLHLNEHGRILLGSGKFALLSEIDGIAKENGYSMKLLEITHIPVSAYAKKFDNDFRIYEFVKK